MNIKTKNRNKEAFTLIELVVVMIVIVILSSLIIPNLIAAKLSANETSAIANLRQIATSQELFILRGPADTDDDGQGEYGGFIEMSGAGAGRMTGLLIPPVLSGAFRVLNANGEVSRSGYFYRVYLPDPGGAGVAEPQAGYADDGTLDGDLSETVYCVYVWPVNFNQSGNRTFFINQEGVMLFAEDNAYSGTGNGPAADAAFQTAGTITGAIAVGVAGQDGNTWKVIN